MIFEKNKSPLTEEEGLLKFEELNEKFKKKKQLKNLEDQIASTDYQIIKCYEYSLAGLELPYDIQILHTEREAIREQIRELENTN